MLANFAAAQAVFLFGKYDNRAALGSFVGEAGQLSRIRQLTVSGAIHGDEFHRLSITQCDRSGLIEEQGVHVACRFDGFAAHRKHVVLHHAVHAGNTDGRQKTADCGRNQTDQK